MLDNYTRTAKVLEIIDGDTFRAEVDLGFYIKVVMLCRLYGLNARELKDPGGLEAKNYLTWRIPPGSIVNLTSIKPDKYAGRFDAIVYAKDKSTPVNTDMILDGYAIYWDGKGTPPVPLWPNPYAVPVPMLA